MILHRGDVDYHNGLQGGGGLGDASLPSFVDEVARAAVRAQQLEASNSETKAYRVEYVGLPRTVQASDRVEGGIPARNDGTDGVRLEALFYAFALALDHRLNERKRPSLLNWEASNARLL